MTTGHNSQLKSIVERVVQLEEEKKERGDSIKEIMEEAKSNGHDVKAIKALVKISMETADQRAKRLTYEEILETYKSALGMLYDLPLGQAATERAVA